MLTASRTAVTYPHSAKLYSNVAAPSVIMRRLAGSSTWATFVNVPSGNSTITVKPTSTAAYEVVTGGIESAPVTMTVAAQLSKPQVKAHGHRHHKLTIKGWVKPVHASGNVQLTFFRWEKVGTKVVTKGKKTHTVAINQWVQHGDPVDVSLKTHKKANKSDWSYKWTPSATGKWKIVVSHEDVAHVHCSASARTTIKH